MSHSFTEVWWKMLVYLLMNLINYYMLLDWTDMPRQAQQNITLWMQKCQICQHCQLCVTREKLEWIQPPQMHVTRF